MQNGDELSELDSEDLGIVVDLCAESLPNHHDEVNGPLDGVYLQFTAALKAEETRSNCLESILNAMKTVARLDSTCEELSNAAKTVFDISDKDRRFEPDWLSLKEALEIRGLTVEIVRLGNLCLGPSVRTEAGNKAQKNADRALAKVVQATNEQIALSKQIPGAQVGFDWREALETGRVMPNKE